MTLFIPYSQTLLTTSHCRVHPSHPCICILLLILLTSHTPHFPPSSLPTLLTSYLHLSQICQAAQTRQSSLCTNPLSAVNVLANNTCLSAGEASVAGWNLNPSNNGASLIYYHGVNITHVNDWSTRIYFECAPTAVCEGWSG